MFNICITHHCMYDWGLMFPMLSNEGFCNEWDLLPSLHLFIRHPVVIPPCDELDDTYKLEDKKNAVVQKQKSKY